MKSGFLSFSQLSLCACLGAIAIGFVPIHPASSQPLDGQINPPANILKSLNLSDTQRQQIQAILAKEQDVRRASIQELRAKEQELRTMMDGNATREALLQKFNQIQELRRQNEQRRFAQMLEIREVLTTQQRSQLSKAVKESVQNFHRKRRLSPDNQL